MIQNQQEQAVLVADNTSQSVGLKQPPGRPVPIGPEQGIPDMSDGYIKLHRKMLAWPWLADPPTCHLFVYCLLKANWGPKDVAVGGVKTHLEAGQFIFGRKMASKETGLSEQSIRTALKKLTMDGCVKSTNHPTNLCSIVTVCNWATYQSREKPVNQPINQASTNLQPTSNQPPTTDKKDKKGKNEKNNIPPTPQGNNGVYSSDFLLFWEAYPKKVGKGGAWKAWKRLGAGRPPVGMMREAVHAQQHSEDWMKEGGRYIPHPATWLNGRRWEDELQPLVPITSEPAGMPALRAAIANINAKAQAKQQEQPNEPF